MYEVCMKAHGLVKSELYPIEYMNYLYELITKADKVITF